MAQSEEVHRPLLIRVLMPILRFMVMHRLGPLGKRLMIISYPEPATGKKLHSMPIGYLRAGRDLIVVAAGENIDWYRALENMPSLMVYSQSGAQLAMVKFIENPDEIAQALDGYRIIYAGRYERFLGVPSEMSSSEAARSEKLSASFVRFTPLERD